VTLVTIICNIILCFLSKFIREKEKNKEKRNKRENKKTIKFFQVLIQVKKAILFLDKED